MTIQLNPGEILMTNPRGEVTRTISLMPLSMMDNLDIQCGSCGKDLEGKLDSRLSEEIESVMKDSTALFSDAMETEDKLRELKMFIKMQELGLTIDYRCPACRIILIF